MTAIVVTDCFNKYKALIPKTFDDYIVWELTTKPDQYFEAANSVPLTYYPHFLLFENPVLAAIVAARLALHNKHVYVVEPEKDRLRILKYVPR
jgi:hypothetical protein